MSPASASIRALGTTALVAVTVPEALRIARRALVRELRAFDLACSRFRTDSELATVNRAAGTAVAASTRLREAIRCALRAAELTGGLVDPTVGRAMRLAGYDRTFMRLELRDGRLVRPSFERAGRWREIVVDDDRGTVRVPAGVELDLGATAKALAADRIAAIAALETGAGVLVSIGGDIAVAGGAPEEGWAVGIADDHAESPEQVGCRVALASGGLASSGTSAPLDDRRRRAPPHPRPSHRPARRRSLGHRFGRGRILRRCEHRQHRGDRARRRSSDVAFRPAPAGAAGAGGRRSRRRRRLACGEGCSVSILAATGPSVYWYLTRGSGVVALLLLTASIVLGIVTTIRWSTTGLPRFAVAGLHRTLTLLAIVFVAVHVVTTVVDGFAPIGWKDAFIPFLSPYRPVWLGLGAVAFDLLLALVITSLLRARIGYRVWRATHWLAYASWPVALMHSLGTGSDARVGWLHAIAIGSVFVVGAALVVRLAYSNANAGRRLAVGAAALAVVLGVGSWYRSGPGSLGWAARAGTPAALLAHSRTARAAATVRTSLVSLPGTFHSQFVGRITESQSSNGMIDVRIDGTLSGGIHGRLRLVLKGAPLEDGGVSMTASGVAFAAAGSPSVYEGRIVGLQGTSITARVAAGSQTVDLQIGLQLQPNQTRVTGTVQGVAA